MKKLLAALVVAILAYIASPYAAVALVMRAVTQGDEDALASRIDFDALRTSLTQQLEARMARPGEPTDGARMMLPTIVNSFVTPRGFATMLRGAQSEASPGDAPADAEAAGTPKGLGDLEIGWFFFTGPTRFEVHSRRGNMVLEPRGAWWRVVDLKLPTQERGPLLRTPPVEPPLVVEPPELETPDFGAAGS